MKQTKKPNNNNKKNPQQNLMRFFLNKGQSKLDKQSTSDLNTILKKFN